MEGFPKEDYEGILYDIFCDVNKNLGPGYDEDVYQKAMEVCLRELKIPYESQRQSPITFKNHIVGINKPDLIITLNGKKILIELKALTSKINNKEIIQLKRYMHLLDLEVGYLVNFRRIDYFPEEKDEEDNSMEDEMIDIYKATRTKKEVDFDPSSYHSSSVIDDIRKKYPSAYTPWTKEDDKRLIELHKRDTKTEELSEIFGRQESAINTRLKRILK